MPGNTEGRFRVRLRSRRHTDRSEAGVRLRQEGEGGANTPQKNRLPLVTGGSNQKVGAAYSLGCANTIGAKSLTTVFGMGTGVTSPL